MRSSWAQGLLLVLLCTGSAAAEESAAQAADEAAAGRGDACLTDRTCQDLYKRARALSRTGQLDAAAVLYREAYKRREAAWLLPDFRQSNPPLPRVPRSLNLTSCLWTCRNLGLASARNCGKSFMPLPLATSPIMAAKERENRARM